MTTENTTIENLILRVAGTAHDDFPGRPPAWVTVILDANAGNVVSVCRAPTDAEAIAIAKRMVACWMACDGIGTDLLEGFSPRFLATYPSKVLAERQALEAQRDELLTALIAIVEPGTDSPEHMAAEALIVKHKGKAA